MVTELDCVVEFFTAVKSAGGAIDSGTTPAPERLTVADPNALVPIVNDLRISGLERDERRHSNRWRIDLSLHERGARNDAGVEHSTGAPGLVAGKTIVGEGGPAANQWICFLCVHMHDGKLQKNGADE